MIELVPFAKEAATHWPRVVSWLEQALDKTGSLMTVEDLYRGVRTGNYRLWLIHQKDQLVGAFVTEIVRGGRGAGVNVLALGGVGMPEWIAEFDAAVEAYARANECAMIVEMGRSGWTRVLERLGWQLGPAVMVKVTR